MVPLFQVERKTMEPLDPMMSKVMALNFVLLQLVTWKVPTLAQMIQKKKMTEPLDLMKNKMTAVNFVILHQATGNIPTLAQTIQKKKMTALLTRF